jgi:hypothetical protein
MTTPTITPNPEEIRNHLNALQDSTLVLLRHVADTQAALTQARLENQRLTDLLDQATAPTPTPTLAVVKPKAAKAKVIPAPTPEEGVRALSWIKERFPKVIRLHIHNSLAHAGYLTRGVKFGRPHFTLTEAGAKFFYQAPYATCPNYLELYIRPEGMAEVDRLYKAGLLITKATGREPS